jgi:RHS repeat-associated protein
MVQVANQNQPLATYAYNYLGQRAAKTTPAAITQFVYDRSGHLLAESNGTTGAAQTEYVWLGDMPLALVTNGSLYFIHPDHLGAPQKATDASQNLAWNIVPRPFGQTEQQTFPPLSNLRFPGQYFDAESGLHQNWFRDYDPTIGRYVESDPIGLSGGLNTYAYANANPFRYSDPRGTIPGGELTCVEPINPVCAESIIEDTAKLLAILYITAQKNHNDQDCDCEKERTRLEGIKASLASILGLAGSGPSEQAAMLIASYNRQVPQVNRDIAMHNAKCPNHRVEPIERVPLGPSGAVGSSP